jgi:phenylpropionate dioxygenase-like ring-hydroxylating dioxygenase large terminal subunit
MDFIRNCWYVAGWSSEFGRELVPATILGDNIVFWRTEAGEVTALQDRCPHKLLPLSKGRLVGDDVQCGYHGVTFGCDGKCVRVPGQDFVPKSAQVRRYLTFERHNIVWVWMGAEELANTDQVFELAEFSSPDYAAHQGNPLHYQANYLNVADNLCDPAHVSFVHPTTLGNAEMEDLPIDSEMQSENVVVTSRWTRDAPPVGVFQALVDFGVEFSGNVDRWQYYIMTVPNVALIDFGSADVADSVTYERRAEAVHIYAIHFLTPVDNGQTIDRWMHVRNFALEDKQIGNRMNELFNVAFAEDKIILEAIEQEEQRDVPDAGPALRIAIDKGSNLYRRRIAALIKNERAELEVAVEGQS